MAGRSSIPHVDAILPSGWVAELVIEVVDREEVAHALVIILIHGVAYGLLRARISVPTANGMIDFDAERLRKAAPGMLAALGGCLFALDENLDGAGPSRRQAIEMARVAIAKVAEPQTGRRQS